MKFNSLVNAMIFALSAVLTINLTMDIHRKMNEPEAKPLPDIVVESQKNIADRDKIIHDLEISIKVLRGELATLKAKVPSLEYHANNAKADLLTLDEWHDKITRDLDNKFRFMFDKFENHDKVLKDHAEKFDGHDAILFRYGIKIDKLEVDALPWEEIKQRKPDVICVPHDENSSEGDTEN